MVGWGKCPSNGHDALQSGTYTAAQAAAAYHVSGNGAGETVAMPEFGGYIGSDVSTFAAGSNLSLTSGQIQIQTVDGGATPFAGGESEASLDSEVVLGQAPLAKQLIINAPNTGSGVIDAYTAIAQDEANGVAIQAVTTSWASPDMTAYQSPFTSDAAYFTSLTSAIQQIIAGGATVFAASGDSGAYANSSQSAPDNQLAVNMPAEIPQVTGTGGTQLPVSSGQAETAWTTAAPLASPSSGAWLGGASGGGYSPMFAQPAWQHAIMPTATQRTVPDVAADSNTGIWIYTSAGPGWVPYGGTSAAAPQWAAGLVDALSSVGHTTGLGNINPVLYATPERSTPSRKETTSLTRPTRVAHTTWSPALVRPTGPCLVPIWSARLRQSPLRGPHSPVGSRWRATQVATRSCLRPIPTATSFIRGAVRRAPEDGRAGEYSPRAASPAPRRRTWTPPDAWRSRSAPRAASWTSFGKTPPPTDHGMARQCTVVG